MSAAAASQAPLLFIRPIGFNAAESMAIALLMEQLSDASVRWRLPPPGVAPDAYIAHIRCLLHTQQMNAPITQTAQALAIGQAADGFYALDSGLWQSPEFASQSASPPLVASITQPDMLSTFSGSAHALAGLHLDPQYLTMEPHAYYRGAPLCLIGCESDSAHTWEAPHAETRQQLQNTLQDMLPLVDHLRVAFRLGQIAIAHKAKWDLQQLVLQDGDHTVAVIQTRDWQIHLSPNATALAVERAEIRSIGLLPSFETPGHEQLPIESVLWVYAQRCEEATLTKICGPELLRQKLTLRRPALMSNAQMGRHCTSILRRIDMQPMTADELEAMLRMSRPSLMRSLVSLAITRVIAPESTPDIGFNWTKRLGNWLHHWQQGARQK